MSSLLLTSSLLQTIRNSNRRLSLCLDSIAAKNGSEMVTPEQLGSLLSELLTAGARLRAQPLPAKGNDLELDDELAEYRRQVERLRDILPSIQRTLLAERARIEAQRSRLHSAGEWVRTSRQTL